MPKEAASRTRLEILTLVSWLSSRLQSPTEEDLKKLKHTLGYLSKYSDCVVNYLRGENVCFRAFIDASFGIHHDRSSRTGPIRHAFSPSSNKLFNVRPDSKLLDEDNKGYFHSMVARLLYLAKMWMTYEVRI